MAHTAHDKIRYDKRNARTRPRTTYTGCTRGGRQAPHSRRGYLFHLSFSRVVLFHMPDTCRMADLLLLANNPNITLTPGFPA